MNNIFNKRTVLTVLPLDKKNRMVRAGVGLHDGKFFIRVDLWLKGYRWTFETVE